MKYLNILKQIAMLLVLLIPLQLIGGILLIVPCIFYDIGKLPRLLRWFDSADPFAGRDVSAITLRNTMGSWSKYCWLAWRNPLNYFGYFVLGLDLDHTFVQNVYTDQDSYNVGDGFNQHEGIFYTEVIFKEKTYFEYYLIKKYSIFGQIKCIRLRFGHKLGIASPGDRSEWVCCIQPYHSYDGT